MPKRQTTTKVVIDDLDYDLAMLGDPISDDSLDVLSSITDARDAIEEMLAIYRRMQARLEAGEPAYQVTDSYTVDLDALASTISAVAAGVLR